MSQLLRAGRKGPRRRSAEPRRKSMAVQIQIPKLSVFGFRKSQSGFGTRAVCGFRNSQTAEESDACLRSCRTC
jgi:hypothetical protein